MNKFVNRFKVVYSINNIIRVMLWTKSFTARTTSAVTVMHKLRDNCTKNTFIPDYKKPELSCRMSSSSLFFKLQGRKSRDNFTNILLKIQNDLSMLSNKLSNLESKIPT